MTIFWNKNSGQLECPAGGTRRPVHYWNGSSQDKVAAWHPRLLLANWFPHHKEWREPRSWLAISYLCPRGLTCGLPWGKEYGGCPNCWEYIQRSVAGYNPFSWTRNSNTCKRAMPRSRKILACEPSVLPRTLVPRREISRVRHLPPRNRYLCWQARCYPAGKLGNGRTFCRILPAWFLSGYRGDIPNRPRSGLFRYIATRFACSPSLLVRQHIPLWYTREVDNSVRHLH